MADHNRDATIRMAIAKIFEVFRGGGPCEESKHFVLPMLVLKYLSDVSDSDCGVRLSYRVPRQAHFQELKRCLLYTSPSPRDGLLSRMPSSA